MKNRPIIPEEAFDNNFSIETHHQCYHLIWHEIKIKYVEMLNVTLRTKVQDSIHQSRGGRENVRKCKKKNVEAFCEKRRLETVGKCWKALFR